ncbi:exported hypothetical protein [Vibrio nigripulchritudo AM115]|nr:exported hypothetical protein [Vibrio nigripulchritudo AM115]
MPIKSVCSSSAVAVLMFTVISIPACLSLLEAALDGEFDSHAFAETAEQIERAAIKASFMIFIFPSLVIKNRILYGHQRLENHQY